MQYIYNIQCMFVIILEPILSAQNTNCHTTRQLPYFTNQKKQKTGIPPIPTWILVMSLMNLVNRIHSMNFNHNFADLSMTTQLCERQMGHVIPMAQGGFRCFQFAIIIKKKGSVDLDWLSRDVSQALPHACLFSHPFRHAVQSPPVFEVPCEHRLMSSWFRGVPLSASGTGLNQRPVAPRRGTRLHAIHITVDRGLSALGKNKQHCYSLETTTSNQ